VERVGELRNRWGTSLVRVDVEIREDDMMSLGSPPEYWGRNGVRREGENE